VSRSQFTDRYSLFRELLTAARQAAGLTQAELASRLGKPQTFVSKYERGERRLDVVEFLQIAGALQTDPHAFIERLLREGASDDAP